MAKHSHRFVETFGGLVAFGLDRRSDEDAVQVYLQKFSDDRVMKTVLERMSDEELSEVFDLVTRMLKRHLSEAEYHRLFLQQPE